MRSAPGIQTVLVAAHTRHAGAEHDMEVHGHALHDVYSQMHSRRVAVVVFTFKNIKQLQPQPHPDSHRTFALATASSLFTVAHLLIRLQLLRAGRVESTIRKLSVACLLNCLKCGALSPSVLFSSIDVSACIWLRCDRANQYTNICIFEHFVKAQWRCFSFGM